MTRPLGRHDEPLQSFGALLAAFRRRARLSQLQLALEAGVSARHLGFLELGRSQPSRPMIARLAKALELRAFERDQLFLAAGFLPTDQRAEDIAESEIARRAFDTAAAIYGADAGVATAVATRFFDRLGIEYYATATLGRDAQQGIILNPDAAGRPPGQWLDRYVDAGYLSDDPVIRWNLTRSGMIHSNQLKGTKVNERQLRMFAEATELGIGACLSLPVRRPDGRIRSFCAWSERIEVSDAPTVTAVRLVAGALLDAQEAP